MELVRNRKTRLSIDLAPLIDVVFQLLVFFMLTSTFAQPVLNVKLPQATTADTVKENHIIIAVDQEGQVALNGDVITFEQLSAQLENVLQEHKTKSVHIRGDQNMPYKFFVEVMDLARQAGAKQVNIVHQTQ